MSGGCLVAGRAVRLYVLDYGLFRVNAGRTIGICGYLIQTDAGANILVDTGFPAKYAEDFAAAGVEDDLGSFGHVLALDRTNLPAGQLAKIGLAPGDIDLLVITHTHIDHVGGIGGFTHCPIAIAQAERNLERPLYWGRAQPMEWPEADYVVVTGDRRICDGLHLLMTPGHSPGHMSLVVDLPETGTVVLTADAISRPAEIGEKFAGSWDEPLARRNAEKLMRIAGDRNAFIIYGHCPEQWKTLKKAPGRYC